MKLTTCNAIYRACQTPAGGGNLPHVLGGVYETCSVQCNPSDAPNPGRLTTVANLPHVAGGCMKLARCNAIHGVRLGLLKYPP
jgi:hypothetical protein